MGCNNDTRTQTYSMCLYEGVSSTFVSYAVVAATMTNSPLLHRRPMDRRQRSAPATASQIAAAYTLDLRSRFAMHDVPSHLFGMHRVRLFGA